MSASAIEWTERTWNPIVGCSVHSAGCTKCYAMKLAARLEAMFRAGQDAMAHYAGTTQASKAGAVWTGQVNVAPDAIFLAPLQRKKATTWFVNSMSDLFHESLPDAVIDRVFAVMGLCPQHRFQVLTKRADRMRLYLTARKAAAPIMVPIGDGTLGQHPFNNALKAPANIWLGVSVEDQKRADERIPDLLATPAAVRFLSCEPLLGPVELRWIAEPDMRKSGVIDALLGCNWIEVPGDDFRPQRPGHQDRRIGRWVVSDDDHILASRKLDWVIVGGESGTGAREFAIECGIAVVDQCAAAGVPVFVKQLGARPMLGGKRWNTDDRKGGDPAQWPEALRVRKMPA